MAVCFNTDQDYIMGLSGRTVIVEHAGAKARSVTQHKALHGERSSSTSGFWYPVFSQKIEHETRAVFDLDKLNASVAVREPVATMV
jgi:hypothetical protein